MFNNRASSSAAIKRLTIEYKQLSTDPNSLFPAVGPISEDNYLEWEALLPGPDGTPFEGGVFSARLSFPASYPLEPPTMRFEPPIFHPNGKLLCLLRLYLSFASCLLVLFPTVYADGLVCISILHAPGDDPNSECDMMLVPWWRISRGLTCITNLCLLQCMNRPQNVGRQFSRSKRSCSPC